MLVTKIIPQKRDTTKYNIYMDGEYVFALPAQDMEYFNIKEGKEVSEKTVNFIQKSLIYIQAQDKALHFIGYKMRTEKEVRQKLTENGFTDEITDEVINFLIKYKYIDDRQYAQKYIKERLRFSPRGAYALQMELLQKGIPVEFCKEALLQTDFSEIEDALRWLEKKTRGQWPPDEKKRKQLYGFLQRKGYSYGVIKDAFEKMDQE
ncbi:regulatory protein RecX [Anaerotignum neopropionicum]|uniref:Regulatory protein RecX n=1 Tax=Anaerotignum neopropionicum TaxID=36847 RepID=A0A136WDR9_9FIRM|nr:RecX family transcriptional regulator [Anaerotignum neopropionicum]KXL52667.1 regulatory protein RecX [Anaerotignum neopropionicum]